MAASNNPIFLATPNAGGIGNAAIATANTAKDGTGTVLTVFTAGANGSWCDYLTFRAIGTNIATVARAFLNNGGANSSATNNILIGEITLSATTLSEVAALTDYILPIRRFLPASYKINVTIGTTVAAGYMVSAAGGDY